MIDDFITMLRDIDADGVDASGHIDQNCNLLSGIAQPTLVSIDVAMFTICSIMEHRI